MPFSAAYNSSLLEGIDAGAAELLGLDGGIKNGNAPVGEA